MGFGGIAGSRRHSSVPRGTSMDVESTSTLHNSSPLPVRNFHSKRMERLHPYITDLGNSRLSLNTCAFGSDMSETPESFGERGDRRPRRPRTVLSSIASSADDHKECLRSQGTLNRIRESKSMDPIPSSTAAKTTTKTTECYHDEVDMENNPVFDTSVQLPRRSSSLENCHKSKCNKTQVAAPPPLMLQQQLSINNNSFPNGNVVSGLPELDNNSSVGGCEDVEVPLLRTPSLCDNITILHRRRQNAVGDDGHVHVHGHDCQMAKRWRSLEVVPAGGCCEQVIDPAHNSSKKQIARNSVKSWFMGLINGNGLRASNASLRKGVLQGYNDLQTEKESIV